MPELPDLQIFSRNLNEQLKGKTVAQVRIRNKKKLKSPETVFKKSLEQHRLKKVYREGKELHFAFDDGTVLGLHLMLHGKLYLFEGKNEQKHTIIELEFDDGSGLALTDFQGMATPTLNPPEKESPDALSSEAGFTYLKEQLSKTRSTIKNLLLDQKIIRGIGNAYADEILWDAGISPFSLSNKIPDEKIKQLTKSIKKVLKDAEAQIRKHHPDIIAGEVRDFLKIHQHRNKESPGGAPILTKTASSRKTYYTEEQELYK